MRSLSEIEECYKKFTRDLNHWIPEGIFVVNLELLQHFDLLHFQPSAIRSDPRLNHQFHIIESSEKITLINDEFIVWIIPDRAENIPMTYTLIALNRGDVQPQLEAAFIATGIYNTSKLILKVLEKFLIDIQETENLLELLRNSAK